MNKEQNTVTETKQKLNPKVVKNIKIFGSLGGILLLILIGIIAFKPAQYVSCITFLGNDIIAYYDDERNLLLPDEDEIKISGYRFEGWFTSKAFTEEYDPETFMGKKLYAKYEREIYTITYKNSSSYSFPESERINGINVWNPIKFFVKFNEKLGTDEAAAEAWGTNYNIDTDKVGTLFIANPTRSDFKGWDVYLKSDSDLENKITTITPEKGTNYCKLDKYIVINNSDTETGVILVPIFE